MLFDSMKIGDWYLEQEDDMICAMEITKIKDDRLSINFYPKGQLPDEESSYFSLWELEKDLQEGKIALTTEAEIAKYLFTRRENNELDKKTSKRLYLCYSQKR